MSNDKAPTLESFKVSSIDFGTMQETDLNGKSAKPFNLRTPGEYTFKVVSHSLYATEKMKDGAGKQWGSALIRVADVASGNVMSDFVSVPLETLTYTSPSGKTSNVRSQIFARLVSALEGGKRVSINELRNKAENLHNLLKEGATFTATAYYKDARGRKNVNEETGEVHYHVELPNGSTFLNDDGTPLIRSSYEEIEGAYKSLTGRNLNGNMSLKGFKKAAA